MSIVLPTTSAPLQAIYDVPAPAKLNLFLHITGRRADGYHLIQSVFMLIDWCDTLHFELRRDGIISRSDLSTTTGEAPDELTALFRWRPSAGNGVTLGFEWHRVEYQRRAHFAAIAHAVAEDTGLPVIMGRT